MDNDFTAFINIVFIEILIICKLMFIHDVNLKC